MDDLKTQLQQVRNHKRAIFSNINELERKQAEKKHFFSQQFAEAALNGADTQNIADMWHHELNRIESELKQQSEVLEVFSTKEKELQIAIDNANRAEQTEIYNTLCEDRTKLNKRAEKVIHQLRDIVEQLDEITTKQRTAAAVGKLDAPKSGGLPACWYIKQALLQNLRHTTARFDEMLITHEPDILKTGDKFAYQLTFKESVTHE